jgi:UDP-3-O-[3-hydroxymyristoyl] glucosamine N-acyltransferase
VGASFTLGRIAEALGATLKGDPNRLITGVAPLDTAGPEHVSFLVNPRYLRAAAQSAAGAVVVGRTVEGLPQALLRVDSAHAAMLPELVRKVRTLEKRVRELEGHAGG